MAIEPEFEKSYLEWRSNPSPATNAALSKELQPLVDRALIAAGGNPANRALRAKANMMAIAALRNFDPSKSNIKNYLYGQLRGLNRVIGTSGNIIQIPERVVLQRKAIADAEKELLDELGRAPSMQEIANRTGIPMRAMKKIQSAGVPITESMVEALTENQNYMQGKQVGVDKAQDAWDEYVYDSLPARSQAVMERLYGMHGLKPMTASEIAKELKISNAAISQHRKKIDAMLNNDIKYKLFGG